VEQKMHPFSRQALTLSPSTQHLQFSFAYLSTRHSQIKPSLRWKKFHAVPKLPTHAHIALTTTLNDKEIIVPPGIGISSR
jgi:hypothetical protein